ncbi:hypothetical protein VTL71DRAFT_9923 [Oculimacula yallundae]|uniref:Uncharacterized protein n=1 Tax=Oculimacula yallundae TaxID=86028 RepID=A0ABR4BQY4_9HELO
MCETASSVNSNPLTTTPNFEITTLRQHFTYIYPSRQYVLKYTFTFQRHGAHGSLYIPRLNSRSRSSLLLSSLLTYTGWMGG